MENNRVCTATLAGLPAPASDCPAPLAAPGGDPHTSSPHSTGWTCWVQGQRATAEQCGWVWTLSVSPPRVHALGWCSPLGPPQESRLGQEERTGSWKQAQVTWVRIPGSRSEVQGGPTVPLPSGLQSPLSCGRGQWERGRWGSSKAQGPLLTCFKGNSALNVCHPCSPISALSLKTRTSPLDGCLLARAACPPPLPPLAHPC